MTKSQAKEVYLLTDGDLSGLGSVKRGNPRNSNWSQMRLFLASDLERLSERKFPGGEEERERHRVDGARRRLNRLDKKAKRRKDEQAEERKTKRVKQKSVALCREHGEVHVHDFVPLDADGESMKCRTCGFVTQVEEF